MSTSSPQERPSDRKDTNDSNETSQKETGQDATGQDATGQDEQNARDRQSSGSENGPHVMIVGPDGMAIEGPPPGSDSETESEGSSVTDLVEQPAKVMRIGNMIKQLLDEVKAAPLDEASRQRLREIHRSSISELEKGLAPELIEELERLSLPFAEDAVPSDAELRIAQAQLVGWLEGLFHGIQTALFAQQMAARAQLEQMRQQLPPGAMPAGMGPMSGQEQQQQEQQGGGMYL